MEKYEELKLEIVRFEVKDIVTASVIDIPMATATATEVPQAQK